ncbi:MFS transporter [Streptomyces sp. H10-C2]|uniref:MFS transporter n=1 Tax=unclassified Streptomyces TaxID=2593676 RepID=UPI0024BB331F|nr:MULTISPECIES: MFS transporter [unclassified Streptomyces]MDJ0343231.1 MFS transporter [Streptomyces sp. PH10-H1]MDJ0370636.1 MFS transporter [Streptomyces sp. H10-C2]
MTGTATTGGTAPAGRKEWIGLGVLFLPTLLISMDISVLFFALPFISEDLAPSGTQQLWIMDMYGFVLAGMLITMGALGDRIGRRRLLLIGATAFGIASVVAAYSGSAEVLIVTRALLGLGGATLMPSTLALIRNMFHDAKQRKTAISIWTGAMVGGATIGPIIGGFVLEHFWWGAAFLINVPAMVLLLVLAPVLLPEYRAPHAGRFDLLSAVLSLGAVLLVIYGIKQMAVHGVELVPALSIAVGLVLACVFVRRQRTSANPLIDIELFRQRTFSASMLINVLAMFAFIGVTLYTNQYLQLVLGKSPFHAALWSMAVMPGIMIAMTVSGVLANKVRPAHLLAGGLVLTTIGALVLTRVRTDSSIALALTGAGLLAAGLVVGTTLTADLILAAAPPERAGSASALSETGSEFGGALGMAILGSIGTAVYRDRMTGTSPAAHETLGGAAAEAARLPGKAGAELLSTAREAFTTGIHAAAVAAALVTFLAAVLAVILLREVPAPEPGDKNSKTAKGAKGAGSDGDSAEAPAGGTVTEAVASRAEQRDSGALRRNRRTAPLSRPDERTAGDQCEEPESCRPTTPARTRQIETILSVETMSPRKTMP